MGASTWIYHSECVEDPATAMEQIQGRVFQRGKFQHPKRTGPDDEEVKRYLNYLDANFEEIRSGILGLQAQLQPFVKAGVLGTGGPAYAKEAITPEYLKQRYLEKVTQMRKTRPKAFRSIASLRRLCGTEGTHTILDIRRISSERKEFTASPLSLDELRSMIGTAYPTASEIEAHAEAIAERLSDWCAVYVVAYENGRPSRTYFIGCSGD